MNGSSPLSQSLGRSPFPKEQASLEPSVHSHPAITLFIPWTAVALAETLLTEGLELACPGRPTFLDGY